jgi:hypothetical protein
MCSPITALGSLPNPSIDEEYGQSIPLLYLYGGCKLTSNGGGGMCDPTIYKLKPSSSPSASPTDNLAIPTGQSVPLHRESFAESGVEGWGRLQNGEPEHRPEVRQYENLNRILETHPFDEWEELKPWLATQLTVKQTISSMTTAKVVAPTNLSGNNRVFGASIKQTDDPLQSNYQTNGSSFLWSSQSQAELTMARSKVNRHKRMQFNSRENIEINREDVLKRRSQTAEMRIRNLQRSTVLPLIHRGKSYDDIRSEYSHIFE